MKYIHKEVVRRAVKFDDQLLSDLADIADDICSDAIKLVLSDEKLAASDYESYMVGEKDNLSDEVIDRCRRIRYEMESIEKIFSAKMASGSSVSTSDLGQITQALRLESEGVLNIKIEAGRYGKLRLEVSLDAEYSGTEFTVNGPRVIVNDVVTRLRSLFRNNEVDYSILHRKAIPYLIGPALSPVVMVFLLMYAVPLMSKWSDGYKIAATVLLVSIVPVLLFSIGFVYSANFRPVEFEYGARGKRRRRRIAVLASLVSAFGIPIFLNLTNLG